MILQSWLGVADDYQPPTNIEGNYHSMTETHVLLIEDDPDDAYLIQRTIKSNEVASITIEAVAQLTDALHYINASPVDAIFLDLGLPDSSGLTALTTLQQHAPSIPIIVITGLNDDALGIQAVQAGAQDYLVKGQVDQSLLIRAIRYAIERKRLEHNLHRSNRELEVLYQKVSTLEQLKTDMIRIASHDIGNYMNLILGHLYLLTEDEPEPLSSFQQHSLTEITTAAQRVAALTKDILSLERIEGQQAVLTRPIDLSALVRTLITQYRTQVASKNQQLELHIADAVTVTGDAAQLQEAFVNLLMNAIKYTPDNGRIQIRLLQQEAFAYLEIQDSGYGIPDELQHNLFRPFYRAKTQDTADIPGTGLGLHLVKNIIERHQGQMIFSSTYGSGSTFGFRLPIAAS